MRLSWLRRVLLTIGALLGVGGLGYLIARDPGYVLLTYDRFSVETSLWVGFVLLFIGYALWRLLWWLGGVLLNPRRVWQGFTKTRQAARARRITSNGLLALASGDPIKAHKLLLAGAMSADTPLIYFLSAARAAQYSGDIAARDADLERAAKAAPTAVHTIALTRAELWVEQGDWTRAHTQLQTLRASDPSNVVVLRLLARSCVALRDADVLLELLPTLRKRNAFAATQLDEWAVAGERWRLVQIVSQHGDPSSWWQGLPKAISERVDIVIAYADALQRRGESEDAERVLREALDRHWDATLLRAYAETPGDAQQQRRCAERWLVNHPDDAGLLQVLGRIYARDEQWQRAQESFAKSLQLDRDPASLRVTQQALAQVTAKLAASASVAAPLTLGF